MKKRTLKKRKSRIARSLAKYNKVVKRLSKDGRDVYLEELRLAGNKFKSLKRKLPIS
jgi:hypothetical protein